MLGTSLFLLLTLASCDTVNRFRGAQTSFSGEDALAYARTQFEFGPRVPGSDAHRRAGDWIVQQMRTRADTVIEQAWIHVTRKGDSVPMRNIFARIRPEMTQRVLYVAHWDSRPVAENDRNLGARQRPTPGANDGASGVGLLVALADALRKTPPTVGVDLLFVDGEDYGEFENPVEDSTLNRDVLVGARWFADNMPRGYSPIFGIVFDMIGDANLNILQEGHSINAAPEVVSRVWSAARELGYDDFFIPRAQGGITDDHLPLIRKGLRVIDVIDIDYCSDGSTNCQGTPMDLHHTSGDTMDHVSARSLQVVGDVALTLVTR